MTQFDNSDVINRYIGIPWKRGGRSVEEGFDCWGFFKHFYQHEMGLCINEDYFLLPSEQTKEIVKAFTNATSEDGGWVLIDEPIDGCAVALGKKTHIHHVGIWVSGGCIHAVEGLGIVFNDRNALKRNGYGRVEFYTCKTTNLL